MIAGDHKLYDGYTQYYYADYFVPATAAKYDTLYDYLFAIGQLSATDRDEENARLARRRNGEPEPDEDVLPLEVKAMDGPTHVGVQPKIWGKTRPVFANANCEVHHASIDPNTWCSRHFHQWKWNQFYVMSGELLVHYFDSEISTHPKNTYRVGAGEQFKVPPGQWHKFEAVGSPVELIEVYWAEEVLAGDIIRADTGGRKEAA